MLKYRVMTAAILIPVVITVIILPDPRWFSFFFTLLVVLGSWEWALMCKLKGKSRYLYSLCLLSMLLVLYYLDKTLLYQTIILMGVLYWCVAIFLIFLYQKKPHLLPYKPGVLMLMGFFLLVPMWSSLILLKSTEPSLLIFLLVLIWGVDTAAYFGGRKWGKRKLADRISPGKTWAGTSAGLFAGMIITLCYVSVLPAGSVHKWAFVGLSMMTVVVSVFGDLMESMVKREANLKDSGRILPGHGGVMDRIDSLTSASPVFVLGMIYLGFLA